MANTTHVPWGGGAVLMVDRIMAKKDSHVLTPEFVNILPYMAKWTCRCDYAKDLEMGEIILDSKSNLTILVFTN